jgi:hypothetical protein
MTVWLTWMHLMIEVDEAYIMSVLVTIDVLCKILLPIMK